MVSHSVAAQNATERPAAPAQPPTTQGPASSHDPYGTLVPLRVMPKVRVLDPAGVAGTDLEPQTQLGTAPVTFSRDAWAVPHSFEKPPARQAAVAPPPLPSGRAPRRRTPHAPVIVRRSVAAPVPPRKPAPTRVVKVRATLPPLPARQWLPGEREAASPVAMPSILAPTSGQ